MGQPSSTVRREPVRRRVDDMGRWLVITTLLGLLAMMLWIVHEQWIRVIVSVPAWGWALMVFGSVLSVVVGGGLMALIFYSSRMGYDDPPKVVEPDDKLSH
jgi:uncharacterized integral membrane protein